MLKTLIFGIHVCFTCKLPQNWCPQCKHSAAQSSNVSVCIIVLNFKTCYLFLQNHCVKRVEIRRFLWSVNLRFQSKYSDKSRDTPP